MGEIWATTLHFHIFKCFLCVQRHYITVSSSTNAWILSWLSPTCRARRFSSQERLQWPDGQEVAWPLSSYFLKESSWCKSHQCEISQQIFNTIYGQENMLIFKDAFFYKRDAYYYKRSHKSQFQKFPQKWKSLFSQSCSSLLHFLPWKRELSQLLHMCLVSKCQYSKMTTATKKCLLQMSQSIQRVTMIN